MSDHHHLILDHAPAGWQVVPFWSLFRRKKKTGYPHEELLSVYRDHGVVPKASRDDNNNRESDDLGNYQLVSVGDLVTNKMKAWQGSIAISKHQGIVSPAYYVYEPILRQHDRFMHYLFRSSPYVSLYGCISKGIRTNQWDLEHDSLRCIPVYLPEHKDQEEIASFLDRALHRIDGLIDRKTRFIELLKEKRQGLIIRVVTKGLEETVSMKESGIGWIGKTPSHWEVTALKRAFERPEYGVSDSLSAEGPIAVLRMGDIAEGYASLDNLKFTS